MFQLLSAACSSFIKGKGFKQVHWNHTLLPPIGNNVHTCLHRTYHVLGITLFLIGWGRYTPKLCDMVDLDRPDHTPWIHILDRSRSRTKHYIRKCIIYTSITKTALCPMQLHQPCARRASKYPEDSHLKSIIPHTNIELRIWSLFNSLHNHGIYVNHGQHV